MFPCFFSFFSSFFCNNPNWKPLIPHPLIASHFLFNIFSLYFFFLIYHFLLFLLLTFHLSDPLSPIHLCSPLVSNHTHIVFLSPDHLFRIRLVLFVRSGLFILNSMGLWCACITLFFVYFSFHFSVEFVPLFQGY